MHSERVQFLSVDEVLSVQGQLFAGFGGCRRVRDIVIPESTLIGPQTGYCEDLTEMAAALIDSLLLNHAFLGGNKRVAFVATDVFLRMNR